MSASVLSVSYRINTESQCGFRWERSITDMIFTLRQIQVKAVERYRDQYIVIIDFCKACGTVDRLLLWKIPGAFGCQPCLVEIIREFHMGTKGSVAVGKEESEAFRVNHGTN